MHGDQLSRQWRVIRAIEASPNGLTVSEVAKREEPGIRAIYLHLEELQAVPFHLNTPAYLDQIQSGMEIHLRKVAQLRIWLNGGILYIIGLCPLTEEVRMFVLDRIKMLKVIGEQFDFLRNFNLEFIRDLWETFVRSVNNWFAISQSNFSTNVPPSDIGFHVREKRALYGRRALRAVLRTRDFGPAVLGVLCALARVEVPKKQIGFQLKEKRASYSARG